MSKVITYRNDGAKGCFCQIKFDSGERILLSIAQTGIVIFKLKFFGYIPANKIWETTSTVAYYKFGPFDTSLISPLGRFFGGGHPLDIMKDRLLEFKSIDELQRFLSSDEYGKIICGQN